MKRVNITALLLAALMALCALSGCSGKNETPPSPPASQPPAETPVSSVTATDMTGKTITLKKPAERVVALTAADCEILFALGAGDTLVGRGEYCNYPEKALEAPSVNSGSETNVEQIIALKPDLVLMSTMDQSIEQTEALEKAGIAVATSLETDIEGAYQSMAVIGALTGRDEEAAAAADGMRKAFDGLREKAAGKAGGTVYFEVSPLEWGLWTSGKNTYMDEIAQLLGLENIFSDVDGWAAVSEEQVLERNPDHIVTITMYYGEGQTPVEEIMGRAGWQNITAVKNGSVVNASSDEIARPGPRLVDAAESLYEFVYGE